jgi:Glyoxalase-like domain
MRTATPYDRAVFVDHLIYVSDDLDATAAAVRDLLGLGSVPGGVHPGGTYNIIVPLGPPAYLELLGVADAQGDNGRLLTTWLPRVNISFSGRFACTTLRQWQSGSG